MLASFFNVHVELVRKKGKKTHHREKRRTAGGAGESAGGTDCTGLPVTASLARPVPDRRPNTPAGRARENLRSTTIQRLRGKDDGTRCCEEGDRLRKAVRLGLWHAQQARVNRERTCKIWRAQLHEDRTRAHPVTLRQGERAIALEA